MIKSTLISATLQNAQRILKVICYGKVDGREGAEVAPFGIDSSPLAGMSAIYCKTMNDANDVLIGYININQLAQPGENRIFATDTNGNEMCRVWLHNDGSVELGGTGAAGSNVNHAAQYEGLQTAFDQLKSDFNTFITTYNMHTHPGGSTTGTPNQHGNDSNADITPAKLANIKTQ